MNRASSPSRTIIFVVALVLLAALLATVLALSTRGEESPSAATDTPTAEETLSPEQRAAHEEALALIAAEPRREENDPYARGAVDAPLVMVEFGDFRCPYCARHNQQVAPLLEQYIDDGTLRLEWRDLPVFGADSVHVHHAARAAGRQGLFWEYHDAIYSSTPLEGHREWTEEQLVEVAEQIGVPNLEQFNAERGSAEIAQEVEADRLHATTELGITATPAFLLGEVFIPGAYPLNTFIEQIEQQRSN